MIPVRFGSRGLTVPVPIPIRVWTIWTPIQIKKTTEKYRRGGWTRFLVVTSGCCALPCCGSGCWSTRPRHAADRPASLSKARWEWSGFERSVRRGSSVRRFYSDPLRRGKWRLRCVAVSAASQWGEGKWAGLPHRQSRVIWHKNVYLIYICSFYYYYYCRF